MSDISALTGQSLLLPKIIRKLEQKSPVRGLVEGPSGSGKSWLLEKVVQSWKGRGEVGLIATGDRAFSDRSFAAFFSGLSRAEHRFAARRLLKQAVSESGKVVPKAGSLVSFVLSALLHSKERRQQDNSLYLKREEHEILFCLQDITRDSRLLLIADDLHYWDPDSLRLLGVMMNPKLITVYPFLEKLHVIAAVTRGAEIKHEAHYEDLLRCLATNEWHLEYIPEDKLAEVFSAFGLKHAIPAQQATLIYSTCGGHLELIRQLTQYLNDHSSDRQMGRLIETPGLDIHDILHRFVEDRLRRLGPDGDEAIDLLRAASVIGRSFTRMELMCMLGAEPEAILKPLETAKKMKLLETQCEYISFAHDALRDCFLRGGATKAPAYHAALAKCLSILRPSDYLTRAEHLLLSEQQDLAAQLYFEELLRQIRECHFVSGEFRSRACSLMNQFGYGPVCSALLDAYDRYFSEDYTESAAILNAVEPLYPEILEAERDYLFALCLLKKFNSTENVKAVRLLEKWQGLNEKALWSRIQMTLLVALVTLGDLAAAKRVERDLGKHYLALRRSDPQADVAVNILRRKSGVMYGAEVATERCRQAVQFFGPRAGNSIARSPAQYYMALCNLAGNLMASGEFDESRHSAQQAVAFWDSYRDLPLPRLEVAINNLVLSGYLSESIDASSAVATLDQLGQTFKTSPDSYLLRNNFVILKALSGDLKGALRLGGALYDDLVSASKDDEYYHYFVRTNLAALTHLTGRTQTAKKMWERLAVPTVPESDMEFLVARQLHQIEAFEEVEAGNIDGWEQFLRKKYPALLGKPWRFFGRGFLFSDIQFWSES